MTAFTNQIEKNGNTITGWLRAASILAGGSYLIAIILHLSGPDIIAWKGLGVGLLAVYAARLAKCRDGWQIALVMALGAAGDIVLDIQFAAGAGLFALGHLVAIHLYWRNRRTSQSASQRLLALALLILVPLIAWLLAGRADVLFYALLLGIMAAMAWSSRFSRHRVGLGAVLFAISDLLIFARMGPLHGLEGVGIAVWSLYYAGQYLIATGVTQALQTPSRA
jgi:uncharacterized membrane protein YhhN